MSSPFGRSDPRSSPARSTPNGLRRARLNGHNSPHRASVDSPSQQLAEEFGRVYIEDDRAFRRRLDEQADEQEKLHKEALAKSLAEHEAVRQSAERARERLELEMERARRRKAEEEAAALERERRRLAEAEAAAKQKQLDEARRKEEELKVEAARHKELADAQARITAQQKQNAEEKARREQATAQAEADRKAREEAAKQQAAITTPAPQAPAATPIPPAAPKAQVNGTSRSSQPTPAFTVPQPSMPSVDASAVTKGGPLIPTGVSTPMEAREAEHKQYLDLHQRLKVMRNNVQDEAKRRGLKSQLGDSRREFTSSIGQNNKTNQKETIRKARQTILDGAQMIPNTVDITPYLVNVPPEAASTQVPVGMLFMLNHFVKAVIRQLAQEASDDGKTADPLGILLVTIFAAPQMRPNGISLIDIFWAKLHKACPVLFGINGPPLRTKSARARLGWRADDNDEEHYRRMRGFGVGFAAVTLRDFSKSNNPNPAPNHLYWTALARILGTPPDKQSPTQYVVLLHLIKWTVPRFIGFYGSAAVAALRKACIDFPASAPKMQDGSYDSAIVAMQSLPHSLQKEYQLSL